MFVFSPTLVRLDHLVFHDLVGKPLVVPCLDAFLGG
jgi:hypothetical protein